MNFCLYDISIATYSNAPTCCGNHLTVPGHSGFIGLSGRRDGQKDLPLRESRLYALKETF